ncbi:MAG: class I SAM-dependent methyltransferase [Pseudomonadota bacterium]
MGLIERAPDSCILCNTRSRELLIEIAPWKVFRCPVCKLGFLDPRPSPEGMEQLYEKDYFCQHFDGGLDPSSAEFKKRLSGERHRVRFIRSLKGAGNVLDIGCGYGYFLAACRNFGYEASGFDVSVWGSEYAQKKLGLAVKIGQVEDVVLTEENFDIITMWHFLEHTRNPHVVLERASSWLKNEGVLVIDVPNYEGTDARHNWERWDGWSLPYHLWHFTYGSLSKMLEHHGFRVIKYKDYHSDVIKKKLSPIPILKPLARLIAKMYSGTSIAVAAIRRNGGREP